MVEKPKDLVSGTWEPELRNLSPKVLASDSAEILTHRKLAAPWMAPALARPACLPADAQGKAKAEPTLRSRAPLGLQGFHFGWPRI